MAARKLSLRECTAGVPACSKSRSDRCLPQADVRARGSTRLKTLLLKALYRNSLALNSLNDFEEILRLWQTFHHRANWSIRSF